jgi:hypothetical protein
MADVLDIHTRLQVVTEFPTMESSRLTDNAVSKVLRAVKRTMVTGPAVTHQPQ